MSAYQINSGTATSSNPFRAFSPIKWFPSSRPHGIYSIKRSHGVNGTYKLHNLNDAINDQLSTYDKILLEYCINDCSYPIITVSDMLNSPYPWDKAAEGNILGEITERIARRITKYFLKHWSKNGRTGGIFDRRFDPQNRDDFIVAHTDKYVLKIQSYPNLIILKQTGKGKYGYENIKELDGFFDYRYGGKRHILVLESKLEKVNVNCDDLVNNLFVPLRQIFPEAVFSYVLFTDRNSIFVKNTYNSLRQLKALPVRIYEHLKSQNVNTLFFSFNESRDEYEKMKDFLITQYRIIRKLGVTLYGKTTISEKELVVFDGGETPQIKLVKDSESGLWREVTLRHKS
ncbi:MAG: hypothetical protein ACLFQB_03170 [Chitinispirillaceae bacterium]